MSSTAAVPVIRLPQGATPQTPGLYQSFPYIHTFFFDGTKYHDIPKPPQESTFNSHFPPTPSFSFPNNAHVNNVNNVNMQDRKSHFGPIDTQQHRSSPTRQLSPQAPDFTPLFKLPPKELKAVPIRPPQSVPSAKIVQSAKNKVLEHLGKEPKRSEFQHEFTFKPPTSGLSSSTSTLFSQKESTTPPECQPPVLSDNTKDVLPAKVEPLANEVETGKKAERSRSGWNTVSPDPANDANDAESKPASAPVLGLSDALDHQKKHSPTTSPDEIDNKPPINLTQTLAAQPSIPRPLSASSVPADNGNLPPTNVAPPSSNSGWTTEAPQVLPNDGWVVPSGDKTERTRIQKPPQPISLGGWGESHDDHAEADDFEIPPEHFPSETTVPATAVTQESQPLSSQAPVTRNDPSPISPTKVDDTKHAPVAPSTSKQKDVSAHIQEWQMLSKKNVERTAPLKISVVSATPEPNETASGTVNKLAALSISQPAEKLSKVETKAEPNPLEVTQSAQTALPEASEPEVHDLIFDAGTNGSSSYAQDSTLNNMDSTKGQTGEHAWDQSNDVTPIWDRPSTETNENKEPAKRMDAPSFDNGSSFAMPMKQQQMKPSNTTSDHGAQGSMWAPPDSSATLSPTRGPLLLRLKVKLPEGKLAFLEFHEGDCPQAIAERWCRVWKIPDATTQAKIIAGGIRSQLEKTAHASPAKN